MLFFRRLQSDIETATARIVGDNFAAAPTPQLERL